MMQTSKLFFLQITILLCITGVIGAGRKLPKGITPCATSLPDFQECALRNAKAAIPYVTKGIPSYGMIRLDPLFVPEFRIDDSGSSSQAQFDLTMTNLTCRGLRNTRLKSLNLDVETGEWKWQGLIPRFSMTGVYLAMGHVLILPLRGNGAMNFTMENVDFTFSFKMIPAESRGGLNYVTPTENKLTFNMTRCYIRLENLFNGEKAINDQINIFLNENWREVVQELGQPIGEVLNVATLEVLKALTKHVSIDDIFPKTMPNINDSSNKQKEQKL